MQAYREFTKYQLMGRRRWLAFIVGFLRRTPAVQRRVWREGFKIYTEYRVSWCNNAKFWRDLNETWRLIIKSRSEENPILAKYRYC